MNETTSSLRREIRFEPNPPHEMRLRFLLHGDLGATQFLMVFKTEPYGNPILDRWLAEGRDVGMHSVVPVEWAVEMETCDVLAQGHCHYEGSGLQGEELGKLFLATGEAVVWEWLEDRYEAWLVNDPVEAAS